MTSLEIAERLRSNYSVWGMVAGRATEHGRDNHATFDVEDAVTGEVFTVEVTRSYEPMVAP